MRPDQVTVHLPVSTVALGRGGLLKASLQCASALAATGRYAGVFVETLTWQNNLDGAANVMRREGWLHPDVTVRNVVQLLDSSPPKDRRPTEPDLWDAEGLRHDDLGHGASDVYRGDTLVARIVRDGRGRLRRLEHCGPDGTVQELLELGPNARLLRVTHFTEGRPREERWIARDGSDLLRARLASNRDWESVELVGRGPTTPGDLHVAALERAVAPHPHPVILSPFRESLGRFPGRRFDSIVEAVEHRPLRRVAVLHSNHHRAPYGRGAPIKPDWADLFANHASWDGFVTATRRQRDDLVAEVPGIRVSSIPHVVDVPPAYDPTSVQPHRVVLAARLVGTKRIDLALEVMARVREAVPDAHLDIYGTARVPTVRQRLVDQAEALGLGDTVRFAGYEKDLGVVFGGAALSLSTSVSEGFGLAIAESMAYGTPVVAFDSAYGPADLIDDGVNGFLVEVEDVAAMTARVVEVLTDPELQARLAREARRAAQRADLETYTARWSELVDDVAARRRRRFSFRPRRS